MVIKVCFLNVGSRLHKKSFCYGQRRFLTNRKGTQEHIQIYERNEHESAKHSLCEMWVLAALRPRALGPPPPIYV
jgi:hypothetical protein